MRKRMFMIVAVVGSLAFTACSVDTSGMEDAANDLEKELKEASDKMDEEVEEMKDTETIEAGASYQCPDDCENGPVYDQPGPCKKCGKEMEIL